MEYPIFKGFALSLYVDSCGVTIISGMVYPVLPFISLSYMSTWETKAIWYMSYGLQTYQSSSNEEEKEDDKTKLFIHNSDGSI